MCAVILAPQIAKEPHMEFEGRVSELISALEELEDEGKGEYWVELGPHWSGPDRNHLYFNAIEVDDENERIYFEG